LELSLYDKGSCGGVPEKGIPRSQCSELEKGTYLSRVPSSSYSIILLILLYLFNLPYDNLDDTAAARPPGMVARAGDIVLVALDGHFEPVKGIVWSCNESQLEIEFDVDETRDLIERDSFREILPNPAEHPDLYDYSIIEIGSGGGSFRPRPGPRLGKGRTTPEHLGRPHADPRAHAALSVEIATVASRAVPRWRRERAPEVLGPHGGARARGSDLRGRTGRPGATPALVTRRARR